MKEIVIIEGARTPMAEYNGHFSDISAIDLGVVAAKEALSRSGVAPDHADGDPGRRPRSARPSALSRGLRRLRVARPA